MCRLGKFIMDLKRVRHKHLGLAERQHSQALPGLDIRISSLPKCPGAGWVKRCCSGESLALAPAQAQEQELSDYGTPEEDFDSPPVETCKNEASSGVIVPGMKIDTAHIANSALEGDIPPSGKPVLRFNNACGLAAAKFDSAHISSCGAEPVIKAEATSETLSMRVNTAHIFKHTDEDLGEENAIQRVFDRKSVTATMCRDEFVDDDLSTSGKFASISDYLTEAWDEDLEDAMIRCSDANSLESKLESARDASSLESKFESTSTASQKAEPAVRPVMTDMVCKPTRMATCKDHLDSVDGATLNFSNVIEASQVSELAAASMSFESSLNASQLSSHLEEDFDMNYNRMDDELCGDGLLSHLANTPLKFSQQQMDVLEAVACGKSVFITGSAGTGKSFLLMYIIRMLQKAVGKGCVYVTASTGLAACALNGTTLHSFAGIGLGSGTPEQLAGRVFRSKDSTKRWKACQVLVIDEISMIDGELFDKLDYVARRVRKTTNCFGGIQLIVTGDFFQLPPVNPPNRRKYFAFQADCWNNCFDLQVELGHVFRQSDSTFIKMLNEIRKGVHTSETVKKLTICHRALKDDGTDIAPTRLYPLKVDVRLENMQELKALQTKILTFHSVDSSPNPLHRYMLDGMRAEKELQLCVGAQVMLTKNIDTCGGLVNGAKGVVVGFQSTCVPLEEKDEEHKQIKAVAHIVSQSNMWPVVRFSCGVRVIGPKKEGAEDGGVEVVSRIQVPLILAWALSVHKCQGMTLNKVQTDLSKAFDFGMVYVALSRVKDLDGLQLIGFDPTRIKVHPDVLTFFDKLVEKV